MLEPLTVAVMGLELALIIQSKPVRIASDNFGSNSASAFQADAYQQKPHLLLVGRAKPIQSPPLRLNEISPDSSTESGLFRLFEIRTSADSN